MHLNHKQWSSPNSTLLTDQETSSLTPRSHSKRFVRSNSGSRSRSKEEQKDRDTRGFFVKNICQELLSNRLEGQEVINKFQNPKTTNSSARKRPDTPSKGRRQAEKTGGTDSKFEEGLVKELEMLRVEQQLKQTLLENKRLKKANKCLEQKLNEVSLELAEKINQNCFLEEKLKYCGPREKESQGKETRSLALAKIKKMISSNENTQPVSFRLLQEQFSKLELTNKQLQAENIRLREALNSSQLSLHKLEENAQNMASQRQAFLNDLVHQLKGELTEKEEMLQKMRIQLNVFLVRQAKNAGNEVATKSEEIDHIKKKYTRVLKMYHEANQQLAAYKRKNERMSGLFPSHRSRKNSIDSLTLSP